MKTLFPRTSSRLLMVVILALVIGCLYLSASAVIRAYREPAGYSDIFGIVPPVVLAYGLWRMRGWARTVVVSFIWLMVIVGPIGIINPFTAMDDFGPNPPDGWQLIAEVYPWVAVGLFILHVLGKHRAEFSVWLATQPTVPADVPASRDPG